MTELRVFAWNPNGLRALLRNHTDALTALLRQHSPDVLFFPETKGNPNSEKAVDAALTKVFNDAVPNRRWRFYHAYCQTPGRHGTSVAVAEDRVQVDAVRFGWPNDELDAEGRVVVLQTPHLTIAGLYVPNASTGLKRLQYKLDWMAKMKSFVRGSDRPVMLIGDINVAPDERDICHPTANVGSPGFTPQEREAFSQLLTSGNLVDVWRSRNACALGQSPGHDGVYTFWNTKSRARERNAGWRIDLVLLSQPLIERVRECFVCSTVKGSDHCPVGVCFQVPSNEKEK